MLIPIIQTNKYLYILETIQFIIECRYLSGKHIYTYIFTNDN